MFKPIVVDEDLTMNGISVTSEILYIEDTKISHISMVNKEYRKFIFYFHGRYGNMYMYKDMIKYLHSLKFNVILLDYQGYGKSSGSTKMDNILSDSYNLVNHYSRIYNIKRDKITLWGESLGSIPAIFIASKIHINSLIIYGGISSISDIFSYNDKLSHLSVIYNMLGLYDYSNAKPISECKATNALFLHCKNDELIDFSCCVTNFKNCCVGNKKIIKLRGNHAKPIFTTKSMKYFKEMYNINRNSNMMTSEINNIIKNI